MLVMKFALAVATNLVPATMIQVQDFIVGLKKMKKFILKLEAFG